MKKLKLFAVATFVVAFLVGLSFATSLKAQESKESKGNDPRVLAGVAKVTMLDAVVAATREAPGVVTKAELEREKGQLIYSFDILPSPRSQKITEVHIDALTGKVLAKEEEKLNKGEDEEQEEKANKEARETKETKVATTTKESQKAQEAKAVKEAEEEKEEAAGEEEEQNLSELIPAVKISMAQAIKTALADSPGFVLSGELEKENGKIIYSFDILPSPGSREISEIQVDVATGQIVAREKEEIK